MTQNTRKIIKRERNLHKETSLWNPLYLQLKFAIKTVEKYFKNINSGIICDFGCGDKPYEVFCDKNVRYIGIDIDEENDHADVFASVCNKIPISDEFADYCVSFYVLEHVEEPPKKISEMYRILKTNGKIFMLVPLYWEEHEKPYDFFRFTRFGIEYLLKNAGFKEIDITPINGSFSIIGINIARQINDIYLLKPLIPLINLFFYYLDKKFTHKNSSNVMTYVVIAKK